MSVPRSPVLVVASLVLVMLLALSGAQPYDRPTWALEVFPVAMALPVLWATYRRFPLTTLLYGCIFLHALVLMLVAFTRELLGAGKLFGVTVLPLGELHGATG